MIAMTVDFFKRKYGYEIEGMWLPRVTAITSLVARGNMFAMQSSADWGILVHETIGKLLKGEHADIDAKIIPSLDAFLHWKNEQKLEIANPQEHIEKRVFDSQHFYAGTVDLVATIQGSLSVIDFKTGIAIRNEHFLQTAAYLFAYNQSMSVSLQCHARSIVRIDQYGECKGCLAKKRQKGRKETVSEGHPSCFHQWSEVKGEIEFRNLPDHKEDFEAFLSAKEVWEWYYKGMLKRIPNYPQKVAQKILL